jgi:hypothetical protein
MKHLTILLLIITFASCKKFLDVKSDKYLAVPSTLKDAQAILDTYAAMNTSYSSASAQSDDDFYLDSAFFYSMSTENQVNYTWEKEAYNPTHWSALYGIVLNANLALQTISGSKQTASNALEWNNIKGQALFFRSYAFWHIAQLWAPPYNKATASTDRGIPLRLTPDETEKTIRSTVEQTYAQIISDFKEAAALLQVNVPITSRPSKAAAFAALARTCLSMEEYGLAGLYADSCLQLYNTLINYNTLSQTSATPFARFNAEVLLQTQYSGYSMLNTTNWRADSLLYRSYNANDLRLKLFFTNTGTNPYGFKGAYNASTSSSNFNGLATDEVYLIRAESKARAGNIEGAMNDLNTLLSTRWKTNTYIQMTAATADEALSQILAERRKELVGRGLRWFDLRRLNKDAHFAKTLIRKIGTNTYTLSPNDKRYTFYIPQNVINLSGIQQNER